MTRDEPDGPSGEREQSSGDEAGIELLFLAILLAFAPFHLSPRPMGELKDLLILIVPSVTSLVSAVVGYHGSIRGRD